MGEPLIEVTDLRVDYGAFHALFGVSFFLQSTESLAILGTNGSGKSSLARALAGLVPAVGGTVRLSGQEVTRWAPHRIRRRGLVYIPEGRGIFPALTVRENLRMGVRWLGSKDQRRDGMDHAVAIFPILGQRLDQRAGTLSGGEQQMLSLARALAVRPTLLVVDEVSLGLAPSVVDTVFESLAVVHQSGIGIVLIEQFVHRALSFCDRAMILRRGHAVWQGRAADVGADVLESYIGGTTNHQVA